MEVSIEHCTRARVYKPSSSRRILLISLLILLYSIVLPYCYNTAGDPRNNAISTAQKHADEKWEQWGNDDIINNDDVNDVIDLLIIFKHKIIEFNDNISSIININFIVTNTIINIPLMLLLMITVNLNTILISVNTKT